MLISLSNFEEALRQSGKSYKEWSGNITLKIAGREEATSTYTKNVLTDSYGNQSMSALDESGTWVEVNFKNATLGTANKERSLFADFINPEFTYEYAKTTIDHGNKKVTLVFDVTDKYFASSALSTDTTASNITVKLGGVVATNATKKLTKTSDLLDTVNGTANTKIGERYQLEVSNLNQGDGGNYSGVMTLSFASGIIKDKSNNGNIAKTLTVGIDDPTTGDGDNQGVVVDFVEPIWKVENVNKDSANKNVTLDLVATDKYLTGVENSTLTTNDITLMVDGIENTAITKTLGEPTFSKNETTGLKEIRYTLVLSNWEEATKQSGKSFLEYSGNIKIKIAAGTVKDEVKNPVSVSSLFDQAGTDTNKLHIGDFVNYDAGTWTAAEISAIQTGLKTNLQTANGTASLPTNGYQFGGFKAGASRNGNAKPYTYTSGSTVIGTYLKDSSTNSAVTGWRVFDVNGNTVTLISAGNPEDYKLPNETNSAYASEYILSGNVNSGWSSSQAANYQKRDWSVYVNKNQKAVSATPLTKSRLDSWYTKYTGISNADTSTVETFQRIYHQEQYIKYQNLIDNASYYWLGVSHNTTDMKYVDTGSCNVTTNTNYTFSVRMLVTLSSDVLFTPSKIGTKTLSGGNMDRIGGKQTYNCWEISDGGVSDGSGIRNSSKEQTFDLGTVDILKPKIEKVSVTTDVAAQSSTLVFNVSDKYLNTTSAVTASNISVYVNGTLLSSVGKTLTRVTANDESATVDGATKVVLQQYSLVISGFSSSANQVKIKFNEGAATDTNGNKSKETDIMVYNMLKSTISEFRQTSAFLRNTSIKREYVENVTFVDNMEDINRGIIRNFDASRNTGSGHSSSAVTWKDLSGNQNGTLNGGTWGEELYQDSNGSISYSIPYLQLDGVDDWVNLGQVDFSNNTLTLDATISANEIKSGEADILCNFQDGGVGLALESGVPSLLVYMSNVGYVRLSASKAVTVGKKIRITGTYDGTTMALYINGKLEAKKVQKGIIDLTKENTVMAIGTNPRGNEIDTSIDFSANINVYSAKVHTVALTASEIEASQQMVTSWDVSAQQDNSIIAWTPNTLAPYTVYIGSTGKINANTNSSYLFAYIGYADICTKQETIKNLNLLDVSNVTDMSYMFNYTGYKSMTSLNLGDNFNTNNVTVMHCMFHHTGQDSMTSLNLGEKFSTNNVTDMSYMFCYCGYTAMTNLDLGDNFDTRKVTDMGKMFWYCGYTAMTNLDLGDNFDTSNVTDMNNMFENCGYMAMTSLDLGTKFNTKNVTNMKYMFSYCGYTAMVSLTLGENFDTSKVTDMSRMFEFCGYMAMTGLELGNKFDTSKVTDMSYMFFYTGRNAMTSLNLGPAFTKIADTNTSMFSAIGKSGAVIYAPESIYKNRTSFKKSSTDTSTAAGKIAVSSGRTVSPKYRPEWSVVTTYTTSKSLNIGLCGSTKDYKTQDKTLNNKLKSGDISVWIDNTELKNITKTVSTVSSGIFRYPNSNRRL
mgnify:CR=1 FL=1